MWATAISSAAMGRTIRAGSRAEWSPATWASSRTATSSASDGWVRLVKRSASFVNLDDVDVLLRDLRGLASYTVATREGSLVTLVEGSGNALAGVRDDLATLVAPAVLPDAIVPVSSLPRLGNGKADQAGALLLAERALGLVAPGTPTQGAQRGRDA